MTNCVDFKIQLFHCASMEGWTHIVGECNFFIFGHQTAILKLLVDTIWIIYIHLEARYINFYYCVMWMTFIIKAFFMSSSSSNLFHGIKTLQ